ncbi:MAG TPA: pitrilysin family protein [Bacillota bacterium]|jgi:predicted Zn-dependent peptidase
MDLKLAPAGDFLVTRPAEGVSFYGLKVDKFKTVNVSLFIHRPLTKETVTATALAAQLLKRGTAGFPSTRALTIRTEELFGADIGAFVSKYGESQSIGISLDVVDRRYVPGGGDVLADGLDLLFEMLVRPATENGGFVPSYFQQERDNLRRRIDGLINDKQRYARFRCLQEMCPDEGYGLLELGRPEDLPALDPVGVYTRYQRMVAEMPIDILAVGGVEPSEMARQVAERLPGGTGGRLPIQATGAKPPPQKAREVIEEQDIKQGKLVMGYRTGITQADPDFPALLGYNGVLGGFVHSKLFQNVRERAGLAYYAHSMVNGAKGFVVIESGIEPKDFDRAREIIDAQLAEIRRGEISDYELESTRKALQNVIRQGQDNPSDMIAVQLAEVRSGRFMTSAERLRRTEAVGKKDIIRIAERVVPDTVYFLRGREGGGQA